MDRLLGLTVQTANDLGRVVRNGRANDARQKDNPCGVGVIALVFRDNVDTTVHPPPRL